MRDPGPVPSSVASKPHGRPSRRITMPTGPGRTTCYCSLERAIGTASPDRYGPCARHDGAKRSAATGHKRQRCVWIGAARQSGARQAKAGLANDHMRGPAIVRAGRRTLIAASLAHMRGVKAGQASPTTRTGPALCLHSPPPHLRGPTHTPPPRWAGQARPHGARLAPPGFKPPGSTPCLITTTSQATLSRRLPTRTYPPPAFRPRGHFGRDKPHRLQRGGRKGRKNSEENQIDFCEG